MKKLWVLLIVVFMFVTVVAIKPLDTGVDSEDYDKLQDMKKKIPIDPESGKFDPSRVFGKSEAEIRIDAINMWLEENAVWLKVVFGMVPSITWLFAFVLYFWLFFLAQALNGVVGEMIYDVVFAFKEVKGNPTDNLDLIPLSIAQIIGLVLFAFILVLKVPLNLGRFSHTTLNFVWDYGWIGILGIVIAGVILAIFFPQVMKKILSGIREKTDKKAKSQESVDRQVLHKTVEGITGE